MRKIVVLLATLALPSFAQIPLPAAPTKYVTDAAGVIPDDREYVLNERLAYFERTTTHQVIVYVDRKIPEGTTLEEMSAEAIRTWAVGQAQRDNGAILFLFIDSRDSRIEVGYGLEGTLSDSKSKRILVNMRPLLRSGDYAGAVEQGAVAILDTIAVEPPAPQPVAQIQYRPAPVPVRAESDLAGEFGGCVLPFGLLVLVFLILALAKSGVNLNWPTTSGGLPHDQWPPNNPEPPNDPSSSWSPSSFSSYDSSSSSSDSSSSSSSDFSGGGGSGGGGGASDNW